MDNQSCNDPIVNSFTFTILHLFLWLRIFKSGLYPISSFGPSLCRRRTTRITDYYFFTISQNTTEALDLTLLSLYDDWTFTVLVLTSFLIFIVKHSNILSNLKRWISESDTISSIALNLAWSDHNLIIPCRFVLPWFWHIFIAFANPIFLYRAFNLRLCNI